MDYVRRFYFRELLIGLIVAGVPVLIGLIVGGPDRMTAVVRSFMVDSVVTYYFLALMGVHLAFALLNRRFVFARSLRASVRALSVLLAEVGLGILGILRGVVGILVIFPTLWLWFEPAARFESQPYVLILVGLVAALECCALYGWNLELAR